jgi:hypothetical protein
VLNHWRGARGTNDMIMKVLSVSGTMRGLVSSLHQKAEAASRGACDVRICESAYPRPGLAC